MARLRCVSQAERLLVPPFVFFFNLLYPMRQVNDRYSRKWLRAAGGCVLLSTEALTRVGGFACIRDRIIDDVSLARQIKARGDAVATRLEPYGSGEACEFMISIPALWIMVRRTAFTELRYSWARLAGAVLGLGLMFLLPPLWLVGGLVWSVMDANGGIAAASSASAVCVLAGLGAWMLHGASLSACRQGFRPFWELGVDLASCRSPVWRDDGGFCTPLCYRNACWLAGSLKEKTLFYV